jgi:hypothetical protein
MRARKSRKVRLSLVGVAGQDFIGQRQAVRRHNERDDHLNAVRPMVPRIAEAAFVGFRKRRVRLEVSAGEIVEQHAEVGVEQVPPTLL